MLVVAFFTAAAIAFTATNGVLGGPTQLTVISAAFAGIGIFITAISISSIRHSNAQAIRQDQEDLERGQGLAQTRAQAQAPAPAPTQAQQAPTQNLATHQQAEERRTPPNTELNNATAAQRLQEEKGHTQISSV